MDSPDERLDSWKEIAAYLGKDIRTAQRWEAAEGLPIYRHRHSKLDTVYAFKGEIQTWQRSRSKKRNTLTATAEAPARELGPSLVLRSSEIAPEKAVAPASLSRRGGNSRLLILLAVFVALEIAGVTVRFFRMAPVAPSYNATPLSSLLGQEYSPTFSRDGRQVAFVWNGEKQDNFDIYVKSVSSQKALRLTTSPEIDYSPVWSPDGKFIAFCRGTELQGGAVWIIPASGGMERRLIDLPSVAGAALKTLSWSPDGKNLAVGGRLGNDKQDALALVSVDTGKKTQITFPDPGKQDVNPAFSPDGKAIAFVRDTGGASTIQVLSLSGNYAKQAQARSFSPVGFEHGYCKHPSWTPDGQNIVFESDQGGAPRLCITPAGRPGRAQVLPLGTNLIQPSISPRGQLAFVRESLGINIWSVDVKKLREGFATEPVRAVASTRLQDSAKVSPDGKKLAFVSNRSGEMEIWLSNVDGSEAMPLTAMGDASSGSPSWSPDGTEIAFDSRKNKNTALYRVAASGGIPKKLSEGSYSDLVPRWSRDGKWIYFSSSRSGEMQIWKMPSSGGEAQQLTKGGGFAALPSLSGEKLFYQKFNRPVSSIWEFTLKTGEEKLLVRDVEDRSFAARENGLYYVSGPREGPQLLEFFSFEPGTSKILLQSERPFHLSMDLSPDGQWLYYGREDERWHDLMYVRDFWPG